MIRCALVEVFLPGGGFALRGDLRAAAISVLVLVVLLVSLLFTPFGIYAFMPVRLGAVLEAARRGRSTRPRSREDSLTENAWHWRKAVLVGSIGLGALVISRLVAVEPYRVPTVSMEPTIAKGQMIVVDKLTMLGRGPERGEVVAFRMGDKTFVKRVIAFGGDRVAIRDGVLHVNGVVSARRLVENVRGRTFVYEERFAGRSYRVLGGDPSITDEELDWLDNYPLHGDCGMDRLGYGTQAPVFAGDSSCVVPRDTVFVLGDNRVNSSDSRSWGTIPVAWVFGRVVGVE